MGRLRGDVGGDEADQILVVVVGGEIAEHGTHEQLLQQGGVYADLWAEQTEGAGHHEVVFDVQAALGAIPLFAGVAPA